MEEESRTPKIIYTEDEPDWAKAVLQLFEHLGISVAYFKTNDAAYQAVVVNASEEGHYSGVVADYYTYGGMMKGVEFLHKLSQTNLCGDILVLSSTTARGPLQNELNMLGPDLARRVEIFDKMGEYAMAAIYVASRIKFSDLHITREGILKSLGFKVLPDGSVAQSIWDVQDESLRLEKEISAGNFDLQEFAEKASLFSQDEA